MMRIQSNLSMRIAWLLPLVCCLTVGGCGGESLPSTIAVHGQVSWQGKPLTKGSVAFQSVKGGPEQPLRSARGSLSPDGTYQLSTFRTHDGAMPGQYAVIIRSFTSSPSIDGMGPPPKWQIPEKYGSSATSGLSAEVPVDAKGPLEFDFDLTDD